MSNQADTWRNLFPYNPRPLQIDFIESVMKELGPSKHIVIEAANGVGKTISALTSVIPYARKNGLKIIYMARTHSQIDRVLEELQKIAVHEKINGVAMRGREAFCLNPLVMKFAKDNHAVQIMCTQLKSSKKCEFYNNMQNETILLPVLKDLTSEPATADHIYDLCQSANICPAETARKLFMEVEVIACSYLYIFDPMIRPTFLEQIDAELQDLILIIDEAHNLPEMVNNISSDNLSSYSFSGAIREARSNARDDFIKFMESCVTYLNQQNKKMRKYQENPLDPGKFLEEMELDCGEDLDDEFFKDMFQLGEAIRFRLAKAGKEPRSYIGRIGQFFMRFYDSIGKKDFTHSLNKQNFQDSRDSYVTLNLDSLDSSKVTYPVFLNVHSSISTSGTIGDSQAYLKLTGLDRLSVFTKHLSSPYSRGNINAFILKGVTTEYNKRSPQMWTQIVESIAAMANETPANVGVFTPSYQILRELIKYGLESKIDKPIYQANIGMSSTDNDKLVEKFKRMATRGGAVLCSVLGGRSSEGADFPGELMQSVAVVGIPYAPPSNKSKNHINYLNTQFPGSGRLLAYQIPAINRASQAAGRPVRSLDDRAFILLMDHRYAWSSVKNLLPVWLQENLDIIENDTSLIAKKANSFFKQN